MAIRKVRTIPDPVLNKVSKPIRKFNRALENLVKDMFDTMYDEHGVGLAAVQIGILKRILVIDLEFMNFIKGVFINPELVEYSKEMQDGEEGCLSVPGISVPLNRPKWVKIQYQNTKGKKNMIEAEMLMARALLHEMDHLDGKIFVDLLEPDIRSQIEGDLKKIEKGLPIENPKIPGYRKVVA